MDLSNKHYYYLKKSVQILLSISLFSFLVLTPYSHLSLSYFHQILSKFWINLIDKNYRFLIFNGIFVLIIRASGLVDCITPAESKNLLVSDQPLGSNDEVEARIIGNDEDCAEEEVRVEEEPEKEDVGVEEEEREKEDDESDEEIDELNKKCEDFIKKVKQEIVYGL